MRRDLHLRLCDRGSQLFTTRVLNPRDGGVYIYVYIYTEKKFFDFRLIKM